MSPFRFLLDVELGKVILDNPTAQIVQLTVHTNRNVSFGLGEGRMHSTTFKVKTQLCPEKDVHNGLMMTLLLVTTFTTAKCLFRPHCFEALNLIVNHICKVSV